jgi:hypothetical protein
MDNNIDEPQKQILHEEDKLWFLPFFVWEYTLVKTAHPWRHVAIEMGKVKA